MARIAFMTATILKKEWDDPAVKGFVDRIEASVQTLRKADGYIASDFDEVPEWDWGELIMPDVLDRSEFANRYAYTLSLWQDLESVFAYAYNAAHGEALRHRREWFVKGEWPVHVAWWVADGHFPTWEEVIQRYERLCQEGPSPAAFNFKHAFNANGNPIKIDRERVRQKIAKLPELDWRDVGEHQEGK